MVALKFDVVIHRYFYIQQQIISREKIYILMLRSSNSICFKVIFHINTRLNYLLTAYETLQWIIITAFLVESDKGKTGINTKLS